MTQLESTNCLLLTLALAGSLLTGPNVRAGTDENTRFPEDAGLVDVTRPPYNVKADGVTDCTEALQQAICDNIHKKFGLYFPNGTYVVGKTLTYYRIHEKTGKPWRKSHLTLQGESRTGTVLRLKDETFVRKHPDPYERDPAKGAQPILATETDGAPPDAAIENYIVNLTLDVGRGNPGAVGINFHGNNLAALRDVTVRSSDGQGAAGIVMNRVVGPLLIQNVRVEGFRFGIAIDGGASLLSATLHNIDLDGQTECGIENRSLVVSIHGLTSRNTVPALRNVLEPGQMTKEGVRPPQSMALTQLIKARLTGGKDGAAIVNLSDLYLRDVVTEGYAFALRENDKDLPGLTIDEHVSGPPVTLFDGGLTKALRLPVQDPPPIFHTNDFSQWANVAEYLPAAQRATLPAYQPIKASAPQTANDGPVSEPDEITPEAPPTEVVAAAEPDPSSGTAAIRQAFASGRPIVYFPTGRYAVTETLDVPPHVKTIYGFRSQLVPTDVAGGDFAVAQRRAPLLRIVGSTDEPLNILYLNTTPHESAAFEREGVFQYEHASTRPLVLRHGHIIGYRNTPGCGPLWGCDLTGKPIRLEHPQKAWFFQVDPEHIERDTRFLNNGGQLWILGCKTEGSLTVVHTLGGGQTELYGGFFRPSSGYPLGSRLFVTEEGSALVASFGGNAFRDDRAYQILAEETRNGETRQLTRDEILKHDRVRRGEAQLPLLVCGASAEYRPAPVTMPPLGSNDPPPWNVGDIGLTDAPAQAIFAGYGIQLQGTGKTTGRAITARLGSVTDACAYAWCPLPGDGALTVRLAGAFLNFGQLDAARSGILLRSTTDTQSPMVFVGRSVEARDRALREKADKDLLVVLERSTPGQPARQTGSLPHRPAPWLRLARQGTTVTGAASSDGQNWTSIGQATFPVGPALIGVAVDSGQAGAKAKALFSPVLCEGVPDWKATPDGKLISGGWMGSYLGSGYYSPMPFPGWEKVDGADILVAGSGYFYQSNTAEFYRWVWQIAHGEAQVVTQVAWVDGLNPRAMAGLVIRNDFEHQNGLMAFVARTEQGVIFNARTVPRRDKRPDSAVWPVPDPKTPVWLRLRRVGEVLSGEASLDGKNWDHLGEVTIRRLPGDLLAGAFSTSGHVAGVATAIFRSLELQSLPPQP